MRGLVRAVIRLITPPLPAVSRPSKITMTRTPLAWTQVLQPGKLDLELYEFLLELLTAHLARRGGRLGYLVLLPLVFRHLTMLPCHYRGDNLGNGPMIRQAAMGQELASGSAARPLRPAFSPATPRRRGPALTGRVQSRHFCSLLCDRRATPPSPMVPSTDQRQSRWCHSCSPSAYSFSCQYGRRQ